MCKLIQNVLGEEPKPLHIASLIQPISGYGTLNVLVQSFKEFILILVFLLSSFLTHATQWPTIKLIATNNSQTSTAIIAFNSSMTTGLDVTYDAGLLKGGSDLLIYTFLVKDYNGIPFAIQALPDNGYNELNIQVGLDFKTGGEVTFSTELTSISQDCNIILEDKLNNTFTNLTNSLYKTVIAANSVITDRFRLHYSPLAVWTGITNTDWNTAINWSINAVPGALNNASVPNVVNNPVVNQDSGYPAICYNLNIESGSVLTINAGKALSVNGILTNNSSGGIIIRSDATGTGSLKAISSSGNGSVNVQRYMTTGAWHLVSSPLSGQTVADFLNTNISIPTKTNTRGMMDYNPTTNIWNSFFTNGLSNGFLGGGKGFAIRNSADGAIVFSGSLQSGNQTVTGLLADNWNCIGNPYTSAIAINSIVNCSDNFLNQNVQITANLDPSYGAIYIWDKTDESNGLSGQYTIITNTPLGVTPFDIQQGQAFMVKMNTSATSISFNNAMQLHSPLLALKSSKTVWPNIKLIASTTNQKSTTFIAFNKSMSKGLDPTYDAGLLKGNSDLVVYSRLIENNGIPFVIQALPDNEENLIIPIGLDFITGGEVVFSSELTDLPSFINVILEDKLTKTYTDLSKGNYKTTITPNSIISDRFFIHTSKLIEAKSLKKDLNVYAIGNTEIRIKGDISNKATATLYDIHGRKIMSGNLQEGTLNIIPLNNIKIGFYMLSVNDNGKVKGFKILIRE